MRAIKALVVALSLLVAGTALAQDKKKCPEQANEGAGGQKYEKVRGPDGRIVYKIIIPFCIEGKVPKPSVIYVLNASTINYEWENLKQDFQQKTLQSVEKSPF